MSVKIIFPTLGLFIDELLWNGQGRLRFMDTGWGDCFDITIAKAQSLSTV